MPKNENYRVLGFGIVINGSAVALANFFLPEMAHGWLTCALLFAVICSLCAILLCLYSIGFTTIRISLLAITMLALVMSVWVDSWPAKLRFKTAKLQLEKVVTSVQAGEELTHPFWVGSYHVKKLKSSESGQICFWTTLHPYGNTGLVFTPNGDPNLNDIYQIRLDEDWHLICID